MANVAKLKDRARTLEQREQWKEALVLYQQVVEEIGDEEVDTGLWNRIGDLHLRLGQGEQAVDAYDHAVDAYAEAGLHNNAIALCRKILRVAPGRASVYLKLGQISAAQGFLADARQNFLEYAQRMQRAGQLDASFTALKEFADLFPDDTEIRLLLADQLRAHGRDAEAVEQLRVLLVHLRAEGRTAAEEEVAGRILEIDPDADLSAPLATGAADPGAEYGGLSLEFPEQEEAEEPEELLPGLDLPPPVETAGAVQVVEGLETSELYSGWAEPPADDEEPPVEGLLELPLLDAEEEPAPEETEEEDDEEPEPLPLLDLDAPPPPPAPPEEEHRALAEEGRYADALQALRSLLERHPADTALLQKQVEYAFRLGDASSLVRAYLELARHLGPPGENPKARAVYQRVLDLDPACEEARRALAPAPAPLPPAAPPAAPPPPPAADYVDLGALILEDEPELGSTRFVVPEEEPTGDEDQDFADMLAVFKQKVSENIATEDSSSHYDLGLAFMEMGLVDEAIAEFQVALRGGANPLATLEVLGSCFTEKGQYAVASRVLERALRLPGHAEAETIGVIYQLGRCAEALGEPEAACEHYERVVALDIRFRDAAARLEALRAARF